MKTTTLNRIREHSPCADSWEKLLKGLGKTQADDAPLSYATIQEICGLDDALWAARAEPQYNWRLLAIKFARRVQHLNPDPRVSGCLDVAERYANGQATDDELAQARAAARGRWAARGAARDAAWAARGAACDAAWVARGAAWVAACDAAWAAAVTARDAAWAARGAACDATWAARDAAWDAERKEQEKLFLEFVEE